MAPINMAEVNQIIQSFGDAVPWLKPASATINIIAIGLGKVKENKQQCLYLFKRSASLYHELNQLAKGRPESENKQSIQELVAYVDASVSNVNLAYQ